MTTTPAPFIPGGTLKDRPNCFVKFLPPNNDGLVQAVFFYKGQAVAKLDEPKSAEEIMIDARTFAERMNYQ